MFHSVALRLTVMWLAALATHSALAEPTVLPLSPAQAAALGVHFSPVLPGASPTLNATAQVSVPSTRQAVIAAPYAGTLTQLQVQPGDSVRAGAVLAHFSSPQLADARRALAEAQSQSRLASDTLQRDRQLHDEGLIPQARLRTSETQAEVARATLAARQAEQRMAGVSLQANGEGLLRAPLTGVVLEAPALPGQRVEASTLLFRLADPSQLQLDVFLPPTQAAQLVLGAKASVTERQAQGRITAINLAVDATQATRIRVQLDHTGNLRPGETVTVSLHTGGPPAAQAGTRLPASAVFPWQGASAIFLADPAGVRLQPVTVLARDDDSVVIAEPLPAKTRVAATGVAALKAIAQGVE